MKAVVTGGAGFIGSNVVDLLIENKWEVDIIDNLSTGKRSNINPKATFHFADLNGPEIENLAAEIFPNVDVVFHLAAWPRVEPSIQNPVLYNKANVTSTIVLFDLCRNFGVKKIIYSSSSSIYGEATSFPTNEEHKTNPMSPYALQKLIGEQYAKLYCELYDMDITCLRYFNVFGNREPTEGAYVPVVGIWLKQYNSNEPLTITGSGEQSRDFINVINVSRANIICAKSNLSGFNVFNVGSGETYKLNYLVNKISNNTTYIKKRNEPEYTCADITKISKQTNYVPAALSGILDYIKSKK